MNNELQLCQKCGSPSLKMVSISFGCVVETKEETGTKFNNMECLLCGHKFAITYLSRKKTDEEKLLWH